MGCGVKVASRRFRPSYTIFFLKEIWIIVQFSTGKEYITFFKIFLITHLNGQWWWVGFGVKVATRRCRPSYIQGCPPVREDNPRALAS